MSKPVATVEEKPVEEMLDAMASGTFFCVVVCDQEIRLFSNSVNPERLARARTSLEQAMGGR